MPKIGNILDSKTEETVDLQLKVMLIPTWLTIMGNWFGSKILKEEEKFGSITSIINKAKIKDSKEDFNKVILKIKDSRVGSKEDSNQNDFSQNNL